MGGGGDVVQGEGEVGLRQALDAAHGAAVARQLHQAPIAVLHHPASKHMCGGEGEQTVPSAQVLAAHGACMHTAGRADKPEAGCLP